MKIFSSNYKSFALSVKMKGSFILIYNDFNNKMHQNIKSNRKEIYN